MHVLLLMLFLLLPLAAQAQRSAPRFETRAAQLAGAGQDPGFDPLAVAVDEAHRLGMELHAWFNVYRIGDRSTLTAYREVDHPKHVAHAHPEWVQEKDGTLWLDPSLEDVQAWLVDNVLEIVRHYDVDAVHFDFIRYPEGGFSSDSTRFEQDRRGFDDIGAWRCDNINRFVVRVYEAVTRAKPWVKVGSAPLGVYRHHGRWPALEAYSEVFQDSRRWLEDGVHDYLAPQIYWNIGRPYPDFDALAREWVATASGRPVYPGIAAYKPEVARDVEAHVEAARAAGAAGQVFFRYEHLVQHATQIASRYLAPALPVPSRHRPEAAAPSVPDGLTIYASEDETFLVSWTPSKASGADPLRGYAVFRKEGEVPEPGRAEETSLLRSFMLLH